MNTVSSYQSFYFHDYEAFGIHPALDRPSQFAGVRTDYNLNIISEPLVIYCQPAPDYLPNPEAVLITGITPQKAIKKGLCEAEFTRRIYQEISEANTCIVGYNNIRFDDEITRNILYRNFYDPYEYSFKNGNSRWDLLDLTRACYALRPSGIDWPINKDGLPSFKLEHLTEANNIEHQHAHDAMSDVYATIEMAKLIKQKQPRLFDYFFSLRHKKKVMELINVSQMTPLVHVSGMLGAYRGNTALISPISWHPIQHNAVIACDLMGDVDLLINLSVDEIGERLYKKNEDLEEGESRIPIKLIHTNKCPIIAPQNALLAENATRFGIDIKRCHTNLAKLKLNQLGLQQKIIELFNRSNNKPVAEDVDAQLYSNFISQQDKSLFHSIRQLDPNCLTKFSPEFADSRLPILYFRYKARNYPHILSDLEKIKWKTHCQSKLSEPILQDYILTLEQLAIQYAGQPKKCELLKELYLYCQYLIES